MVTRLHSRLSWNWILLAAILLFASFTRLWRLEYPTGYYFDEVYHVVTSKLVAKNDPSAYEWWHGAPEPNTAIDWLHPPLAKLMQGASIVLLGNNSFAWRISSSIMGVGTIALVYFVAKRLGFSERIALLSAFLLSLDGLALVMSRITMNDAHVTFFFLSTFYCYLGWKKQPTLTTAAFTAVTAGLATASKWSGVFVLLFIFADLAREHFKIHPTTKLTLPQSLSLIVLVLFTIPCIYVLSYGQMFLQGKGWAHLQGLHQQIWWYQTNLDATHPYQSQPWQWILDLRPVYAYTETSPVGQMANIYFIGNPLFFWFGALAALWIALDWFGLSLSHLWAVRSFLGKRSKQTAEEFRAAWKERVTSLPLLNAQSLLLIGFVSPWIAWTFSPRIMFFYHYTPALPFLALMLGSLLGTGFEKSKNIQRLSWSIVIAVAIVFVLFYPNWTALQVPVKPFSSIYFALPSWR